MKKISIILLSLLFSLNVFSQDTDMLNTIITAIPFLNLTPNAAERSLAEIGVVATDNNYEAGLFQNPALLSRNKKIFGVKLSYMPWMRNYVGRSSITDIGVYYSINEKNTIASNFYYFNIRPIDFNYSTITEAYKFYGSIKYAHSFSEHFSTGISIKYIESSVVIISSYPFKENIKTYAGDIGFDYRNEINLCENNKVKYDIGLSFENLGPKPSISFNSSTFKDFIPTTIKLGTMWTYETQLTKEKQINYSLAYQAEKLLVPTPQVYENGVLIGMDNNISALEGIFQSFYDAPFGYKEELHEILHKFGGEVMYKPNNETSYALRTGYFSEHYTKGNRKYGTVGTGVKYKLYYLDLAYIITSREDALANTININLGFHKVLN